MFSLLKTKHLPIYNSKEPSPVSFCSFFNLQRIFILFQNNSFMVVQTKQDTTERVVFEDALESKEKIVDCRRVKKDLCVLVGQNLTGLTLVKYVSDDEVMLGTIQIKEMEFFKNLPVTAEIITFHSHLFILKSELFTQNITYFTVFKELPNKEYNYDISITSLEHDPIASKPQIFKALPASCQVIFYKQNEEEEQADWKVKFVPLEASQKKEIDVAEILSGQQWIIDVQARSNNQYYFFLRSQGMNNIHQLVIVSVSLYQTNSKYVQKSSFLLSFTSSGIPTQIIDFNEKKGYFLISSLYHRKESGVVYDNLLEMRSISSGTLMDSLPCNLKTTDLNISHDQLLDYSAGISPEMGWMIHIRTLINKQCLYSFLLHKANLSTTMMSSLPEILSLLSQQTTVENMTSFQTQSN